MRYELLGAFALVAGVAGTAAGCFGASFVEASGGQGGDGAGAAGPTGGNPTSTASNGGASSVSNAESSSSTGDTTSSTDSSASAGGATSSSSQSSSSQSSSSAQSSSSGGDCVPAPEVCNNLDDDCDGVIDDGNPGGGAACNTGLPGVCAEAGKLACKNGQLQCMLAINVGEEVCNGLDDDCNGEVDDGPDAPGCSTYFADKDDDGFGNPKLSACLCKPVNDFQAKEGNDCNDNNAAVNPAAKEVCNGVDDDCNGQPDDGAPECPCPKVSQNGHDYYFCQLFKGWGAAATHCNGLGAHLAVIGDANENAFLAQKAAEFSHEPYWIGLNDNAVEGVYVWQGGLQLFYSNWNPGEPSNSGNEDCVELNRFYPAATWNDAVCGNAQRFICESP